MNVNYNIAPCALCPGLINTLELPEAVYWLPKLEWGLEAMLVFDLVPDFRFAHKRCWKALKEKRRRNIRKCCEKHFGPKSADQFL